MLLKEIKESLLYHVIAKDNDIKTIKDVYLTLSITWENKEDICDFQEAISQLCENIEVAP